MTLLLGSVGEGRGLDPADLALSHVLVLDVVGVHVCLFGSRGVLHISRQFYPSVEIALITVLRDLAVGLGIQVLRFHPRDITHITWYMRR